MTTCGCGSRSLTDSSSGRRREVSTGPSARQGGLTGRGLGPRVSAHGRKSPMTARISSQRYAVEGFQEALDLCYSRGWTDGLPVVPPTEPAVRAMLDAVALEPDAQIAFITNRQVAISAEKV